MQKKLIALAVAGAFAAPAFAATSNVDIYGQMNVSYDYVDSDSTEGRGRVSSNNSHIGFKGAEDLGGGLSAIWQIEYAIQLDQQQYAQPQTATDLAGGVSLRNTFAGLSSKTLGSLTFGTQESPLKTSTGPIALYTNTLADYRSVFTKLSTRADNSVLYTSPSLGGLSLQAMYGFRNEGGASATDDSKMWAASAVYKNGPLYATLAYEANKDQASFSVDTTGATAGAVDGVDAKNSRNNAWRAGVGYTLGDLKLGLAYEKNDVENSAGVTTNDGHAWYVSAAYQMGAITLNAAYTNRSEYTSSADDGAKQWTLGADYAFSKRTSAYLLYTKVDNDTNGTNGIGPATGIALVTTNAGGEASGFALGMSHKF